jgi:aspartate-semialdehyde dehydrogenase
VVGAAGAIGAEVIRAIETEELPVEALKLLDRPEAVGERLDVAGEELPIEALEASSFAGIDVALLLPGAPEEARGQARAAGAVVLDASGASAADASVPLIFPELNDEDLEALPPSRTVAIPSPAAAQLAAALLPLQARAGLARVDAVSLEAVAHRGSAGVEELSAQTVALLNAREPEGKGPFPHRVAFNVVPAVGPLAAAGTSAGEAGAVAEARRLLAGDLPAMALTRVVVPVFYGTLQALTVATARPLAAADARALYRDTPEVKVLDEAEAGVYPMPMLALGDQAIHVGRLRDTPAGLALVTVADEVYWGIALPLVRMAQLLLERDLL